MAGEGMSFDEQVNAYMQSRGMPENAQNRGEAEEIIRKGNEGRQMAYIKGHGWVSLAEAARIKSQKV